MKKTLLVAMSLLVSAPSAFAYSCRVDMVDRMGRVLDSFYAQTDFTGACRDGLRDCNREMRVRGIPGVRCESHISVPGPGPGPGPGPIPNPNPYPPYPNPNPNPIPRGDIDVTLIVEGTMVELRGYSNGDIFNQCMSAPMPMGSVDEITMVTNNARVRRLTTSGWWYNRGDVCNVVMQNLDFSGYQGRTFVQAYGAFEGRTFNINASTKAEALAQCADAYRASGLGQSDELTIGVGNAPMRRITTSGWWSNSGAVCNEVMKAIDAVLP